VSVCVFFLHAECILLLLVYSDYVIKRSWVRLRPQHYSGNNPGQVVPT